MNTQRSRLFYRSSSLLLGVFVLSVTLSLFTLPLCAMNEHHLLPWAQPYCSTMAVSSLFTEWQSAFLGVLASIAVIAGIPLLVQRFTAHQFAPRHHQRFTATWAAANEQALRPFDEFASALAHGKSAICPRAGDRLLARGV